ncbi:MULTISPECIES: helix-turn-helix domain-containing protein [Lysinibacillus]|uniref:helix-turn-helix domain-containing protein n=1 Tax=Lysinibacillus TaxID=400634 RepID=UPI00289FD37B|nr:MULTISPECIES: helix-turn-helix transcriptional regulator [Lysinibacillus]MED3799987.1 helix-turn-helix transcriptional regulator [Lysinibacillus capsici]
MNSIGERIAFIRESANISQRALMKELGISNLGRIEKNERSPGIDIVISISERFNVTTDWLLKGEDKTSSDVKLHLSDSQCTLLSKFEKLSHEEQCKIEGIIDGLLLAHDLSNKKGKSSTLITGEEAATNETA